MKLYKIVGLGCGLGDVALPLALLCPGVEVLVFENVGEVSILGGEEVVGLFVSVALAVEEYFDFLAGGAD
tara:strand:+ start:1074 stop:1283 length:210 start_codon:yes stop_codon:yes gene_type:complete